MEFILLKTWNLYTNFYQDQTTSLAVSQGGKNSQIKRLTVKVRSKLAAFLHQKSKMIWGQQVQPFLKTSSLQSTRINVLMLLKEFKMTVSPELNKVWDTPCCFYYFTKVVHWNFYKYSMTKIVCFFMVQVTMMYISFTNSKKEDVINIMLKFGFYVRYVHRLLCHKG